MERLDKETFQDQAYEHLKKAILAGEIEESVVYSENSFAAILGVSRTPVREAILKLKQEGLLETLPSRGVIIKTITSSEIVEIYGFRKAIEGYCAIRLAEDSKTEAGQAALKRVRGLFQKQIGIFESSGGNYELMKADEDFHAEIIKFPGYSQFISQMRNLRARIEKIGIQSFHVAGRSAQSIEEHTRLLERMEAADAFGAFQAVQEHLRSAEALIVKSV